jgi:hypothetical protein
MKGRATGYTVDAATIVRGLLDGGSNARILLDLAASNHIELHADGNTWNNILWLISSTLGSGGYSGEEFAELRDDLPVVFH